MRKNNPRTLRFFGGPLFLSTNKEYLSTNPARRKDRRSYHSMLESLLSEDERGREKRRGEESDSDYDLSVRSSLPFSLGT